LWEKPDGIPNNLFPYIFKVYWGELEQLQIFWDDYDTPDGTGIRDYVDVWDLVDAHVLAYKKMSKTEASYSDYNVGTGKWVSVFEVIKIVETVVWKKLNYSIVPRREGDIPISFCDTSKITAELWWKASTPISESVANSYKFHKNL
jgi:UDP-glucose 4-epimerase